MAENFWTRSQISRRSALRGIGLGAAGLAGAALIGCGGDDDVPAPAAKSAATAAPAATKAAAQATTAAAAEDTTGILAVRRDQSAGATPGGIYAGIQNAEPENVDPLNATSYKAPYSARWAYPTLLQFVPGFIEPAAGSVEGQVAETFEYTDPTTLILHLRKDVKWDAREPTNSRPFDAEDVVFSWKKFEELSNSRTSMSNNLNPLAPIIDITAIDDSTVQVKTAFAFGPLLNALAYTRWMLLMPRESDGGFDARQDIRGAGPWQLTKWDRSVRMEWRKNPNYWNKNRPYLDGFDLPIIGEYAQRLAQFRAGNMWANVIRQEDLLSIKEEFGADLEVYQDAVQKGNWGIYFGLRPDSIWRDERARKAISMLIDRGQINDTFYRVSEFEEAGWPVKERWHGLGMSAGYNDFWVDPKGAEYTDLAHQYTPDQQKLYQFLPAESKKLMDAAGIETPHKTTMQWIRTTEYGTTFPRVGDAYKGLFESTGLFDLKEGSPEYKTEYIPNVYYAKGDFDGIVWGAKQGGAGGGIHPVQTLLDDIHSTGARQHGTFLGDAANRPGAPKSDALIEKAAAALDFEEQVDLIRQWQVENVDEMLFVPSGWPYGVAPYLLNWRFVKNFGAYREFLEQWEATQSIHWWIDETERKEVFG
jgi:ABC-type transport system substrate-binding protein